MHVRDDDGMSPFLHAVLGTSRKNFEANPLKYCLERVCAVDPSVAGHRSNGGRTALTIVANGCGLGVLSGKLVHLICAQPVAGFSGVPAASPPKSQGGESAKKVRGSVWMLNGVGRFPDVQHKGIAMLK
jgi:hypothetical protein